jgi:hypothetical protein
MFERSPWQCGGQGFESPRLHLHKHQLTMGPEYSQSYSQVITAKLSH